FSFWSVRCAASRTCEKQTSNEECDLCGKAHGESLRLAQPQEHPTYRSAPIGSKPRSGPHVHTNGGAAVDVAHDGHNRGPACASVRKTRRSSRDAGDPGRTRTQAIMRRRRRTSSLSWPPPIEEV